QDDLNGFGGRHRPNIRNQYSDATPLLSEGQGASNRISFSRSSGGNGTGRCASSEARTTTSVARTRTSSPARASTASVSELLPIFFTASRKGGPPQPFEGAGKSHPMCAMGPPSRSIV